MKPVESYDIKMLSIGFTSPSQVIWRVPWLQKHLINDFDADWEN
jgi:Mrp family chromosome partitioning ATPase